MNKVICFSFFLIIFMFPSCINKSNIDAEERSSIENYIDNVIIKDYPSLANSRSFFFFYVSIRDCNCVEENKLFIKENLLTFEKKDVVIVFKTNPDSEDEFYKELSHSNKNKIIILDDVDDLFAEHGNIYATDKFFVVKKQQVSHKLDFKKENFDKILNRID